MKQLTEKLTIGKLGTMELSLPLLKLKSGQNRPKMLLVANQHGDETSGILVIQKLFKKIQESSNFKGTIYAITTANPLGLLLQNRNEPLDEKDLNRQFPGSLKGDLSQRIAITILKLAKDMDLVVDLHCFPRDCLITGVIIKSKNRAGKVVKKAMEFFKPDLVWQINCQDRGDKRFIGSLDAVLIENNIPAITIEMPRLSYITAKQINKVVDGLFNILANLKLILQNQKKVKSLPAYKSNYIYSDYSGIFIPKKTLLDKVAKDEIIGKVIDVSNLKINKVVSPKAGVILTLSYKNFVRCGTKLASIGEQVKD